MWIKLNKLYLLYMECYEPYETLKQKQYINAKGNYLLRSSCCNMKSCDLLVSDIQDTRYKCNDLFSRYYHKDDLDERGNILAADSLCSDLAEKQKAIYNKFINYTKKAGTRKKGKIIRKKHKKHKKSIKKYRKYSN